MKKFCKGKLFPVPGGFPKLLLTMKLSAIFTFFTIIQVTATGYSQISVNAKDMTIKEVLKQIELQSNYRFFYNDELSGLDNTVTLRAENKSINDVLNQMLLNQDFSYTILENNMVVIVPKEFIQQKRITGTVKDAATGEPLPGVNIIIEGTTTGAVTDIDGKYSIEVPGEDAILVISFIGYESQKISVSGQNVIDISLATDIRSLEEVVVVGYGSMKKADLTGSVASVKGDDLTKVNAGNLSNAVAGRLPGMQVTQSNGGPGASSVFKIRGVGSIYSNNSPLVLIDGFEGDINQLAPEDVESISVLKDAASASIYGTRAANGVVLVTTKRGIKNQSLKIEVTSQAGYQWATYIPEILGSVEWARKHNQSTMARSSSEYWVGANAPENQTTNTNWLDYIFQRAPMEDIHASALGGTENLQYSINLGYFNQDGILIGENYKKANLRANIDYAGRNYSLGANLTQFKSWNTSTITRGNAMPDAFLTPPTVPIINPDGFPGTPRRNVPGELVFNDYTPYMDAHARNNYRTQNATIANLYFELRLWKELKFKTVFNVNLDNIFNQTFLNQWFSYYPDDTLHLIPYKSNPVANLRDESTTSYRWESQNLLTYKADFNGHHIDVLVGISAQKDKGFFFWGSNDTYPRNDLLALDAGASTNDAVGGNPGESSLASQFGRLNYSFKERYLFQFNVRRDGSSAFAPGNRWGVFPSVSAGWRISEEDFMKNLPVISNLKLKVGYGTLGNSSIGQYRWLSNVSLSGTDYIFGSTPTRQPGSAIKIGYNDDITWETTTTTNVGFELGLLENKLNFSAEIFDRKTTDVLLQPQLPATSGFENNFPFANLGVVDNSGWEFIAEYRNNVRGFNYGASFNITHVKNKVSDFAKVKPLVSGSFSDIWTIEGEAINSYYGYEVEGIYSSTDLTGSPFLANARAGDFKFKDQDGNDTITALDRKVIGNSIPQFFYGANFYASWKGIDLSIMLQGEFDKNLLMTPEFAMDFGTLYDHANMYKEIYDNRWQKDGDNTEYPALGSGIRSINNVANTTWVKNASYMRIKSIQIGYTLPKKITAGLRIKDLRIFATGSNLFTFTKYPGFDPEMDRTFTRGGMDYPQAKSVTGGLSITF